MALLLVTFSGYIARRGKGLKMETHPALIPGDRSDYNHRRLLDFALTAND